MPDDFSDVEAAFGGGSSAAPAAPSSAPPPNDFSDVESAFANGSTSKPESSGRGMAVAPFVGFNRGLADVVGAPVDLTNWIMGKAGLPTSDKPFGGSESIKSGLGLIGANPDEHLPQGGAERALQSAGSGVAAALVPEMGVQGVARAAGAKVAPLLESIVGSGDSTAATAANAAASGVGAATGDVAQELAPDQYKPLANLAANVAGAGLTGAGVAGGRAVKDLVVPKVKDFVEPLTKAGQENLAARDFRAGFTDPGAAQDALETAHEARVAADKPEQPLGELVPGSKPTTGQLTGDLGILSTEKNLATLSPEGFKHNEHGSGAEQQNAARVSALEGIQPTGAPEDVSAFLRQRLNDIDTQYATLENTGRGLATQNAAGIGQGASPEALGADLRQSLATRLADAKAQENQLWQAVDPGNKMVMPGSPIADAAKSIQGEMTAGARPMSGEEARLFDVAGQMGDATKFQTVRDLRSAISTEMRNARMTGDDQAVRRLTQLRGSVESAIDNAVTNRAAVDQMAVQKGVMHPEDTMAAKVQVWVNDHLAQKDAVRASGVGAVSDSAPGVAGVARPSGTTSSSGERLGNNAGAQGVSGEAFSPIVDEAAAQRIKDASAATAQRAQTFKAGPVGAVLKEQGVKGNYRLPDSAVPAKLFPRGPGGAETVGAYLKAAGDEGLPALHNAAAESLRRQALTPDGMIDPQKFAAWQAQHQGALRALPQSTSKQFTDAANAAEFVNRVAKARKVATDDFQQGALGKVMHLSAPEDVTRTIGGIFNAKDSVAQMRRLGQEAAKNPDAKEGLRKAVADHIADQMMSNTEVGTSGVNAIKADKFQTFMSKNEAALKEAGFTKEEIGNMRALAADLARSKRTLMATRLPGGSNTAQDLAPIIAKKLDEHGSSLLAKFTAGWVAHGPTGALTGVGVHLGNALRGAGLEKAHDLIREAIYNPDAARVLLGKASRVPDRGSEITLRNVLARQGFAAGVKQSMSQPGNSDDDVAPRPLTIRKGSAR